MEIPTHGGEELVPFRSKTVAHVQQGDVLAFQIVECLEWDFGVKGLDRPGPLIQPVPADRIHVVHHTEPLDVVGLLSAVSFPRRHFAGFVVGSSFPCTASAHQWQLYGHPRAVAIVMDE